MKENIIEIICVGLAIAFGTFVILFAGASAMFLAAKLFTY